MVPVFIRFDTQSDCIYYNLTQLRLVDTFNVVDWTNEPPRDKTNKMARAPSEDSDQPGHPPSLIRVFAVCLRVVKDPSFLQADSEDSDQTWRMPRLIRVFAGRTSHFVGFVTIWLKFILHLESVWFHFFLFSFYLFIEIPVCKQLRLIRLRALWRLIWVYTVCIYPEKKVDITILYPTSTAVVLNLLHFITPDEYYRLSLWGSCTQSDSLYCSDDGKSAFISA